MEQAKNVWIASRRLGTLGPRFFYVWKKPRSRSPWNRLSRFRQYTSPPNVVKYLQSYCVTSRQHAITTRWQCGECHNASWVCVAIGNMGWAGGERQGWCVPLACMEMNEYIPSSLHEFAARERRILSSPPHSFLFLAFLFSVPLNTRFIPELVECLSSRDIEND